MPAPSIICNIKHHYTDMYALHTEMFPFPRHLQTPPHIISVVRTPKHSERHSPYPPSRPPTSSHRVHFDDIANANLNEDVPPRSTVTPPRFRRQSTPQSNTSSCASSSSEFEEEIDLNQSGGGEDANVEKERRQGNASRPQSPASDLTDLSSASSCELDEEKIPKPPGEAGRPRAGGYTLVDVLSWDKKDYLKVKVFLKKLVLSELDCDHPFSQQDEGKIKAIQQKSREKFPWLDRYRKLWPVNDIIRIHLKYQISLRRKRDIEQELEELRKQTQHGDIGQSGMNGKEVARQGSTSGDHQREAKVGINAGGKQPTNVKPRSSQRTKKGRN